MGDRLYEQGMQSKHARACAAREAKQRELEKDDCTFAPVLSSTSLALVARLGLGSGSGSGLG